MIEDIEIKVPLEKEVMDAFTLFSRHSRLRLWSLHGIPGHEPLSSLDDEVRCQAMKKVQRTIELGSSLGVHVAVLHASDEPIAERDRSRRMAQAKDSIAELVQIAERSNIVLAVELLPRTCLGNSPSELEELLDGLPRDRIGVCLDVNHVRETTSLPDMIGRLGPRLITTHISDFDGIDERHWLPGKGIIDWTVVWHSLEAIKYEGPWLYESSATYDDPADNVRAIEENFRHLRSISGSK
jgi:sugar phosphate isomerase/epimerase